MNQGLYQRQVKSKMPKVATKSPPKDSKMVEVDPNDPSESYNGEEEQYVEEEELDRCVLPLG